MRGASVNSRLPFGVFRHRPCPPLESISLFFSLRRWRDGPVPGAQIGHQLRNFLVGERVAEGRHLLTAIQNLIGDLGRRPFLVVRQTGQIRSFLGSNAAVAVAMSAALVAKKNGAGQLGGPVLRCGEAMHRKCTERENKSEAEGFKTSHHGVDSLMGPRSAHQPFCRCPPQQERPLPVAAWVDGCRHGPKLAGVICSI